MNGPPRDDAKRWFQQARHDVGAAQAALEAGYPETACFLAQQTCEKALKAFLYAQRESTVRSHSLRELLQRCVEYEEAFGPLAPRVAALDQYYIPTRYPNGLPGSIPHDVYTPAQAQDALAVTRELLAFVDACLGRRFPGH